jgi:hypothetical protein
VDVGVSVGVSVLVGVGVSVGVAVGVPELVGVGVAVNVGVDVKDAVGELLGVGEGGIRNGKFPKSSMVIMLDVAVAKVPVINQILRETLGSITVS